MSEQTRKSKPVRVVVTKDKMEKSRVGVSERLVKHPRYNRYIRRQTRLMFHDEQNQTKVGDTVLIEQTRPYSARKKFRLVEIMRKAVD